MIFKFASPLGSMRSSGIDEATPEIRKDLPILRNEQARLFRELGYDGVSTCMPHLPDPVLKKLGLEIRKDVLHEEPISNLSKIARADPRGTYSLSMRDCSSAHAIYVSLADKSFCDINDIDIDALKPRVRRAESVGELVNLLERYVRFKYPYTHFNLTQFERLP